MIRAALYARVSDDKAGTSRSVEEQNEAGRVAATEQGWQLAAEYAESVSASRYTKRARPEWDRLNADISAGRFGAVILWESSRGSRRLTNWSAFLDSCRAAGTLIHVVSQATTYDLSKARDWKALAGEGIDNVSESDKTSLRVKRAYAAAYEAGRPMGRVPYGYLRRYDPVTKAATQLPDANAPIVTEVIGRIAASEAISRIVTDLAAREVLSSTGRPWSRSSVIGLVNPTYLGKRRGADGSLLDASWPALVDEATYWAARRVLADPARKAQAEGRGGIRPGRCKWLLSYIARCAKCGAYLNVQTRKAGPVYRCSSSAGGCAYAPVEWLDSLVSAAIVAWCARPEIFAELTRVDDAESDSARGEASAERDRLAGFESQAVAGQISAESFARIAHGVEARIAKLEKVAAESGIPPALRDLLKGAETNARDREAAERGMWETMGLSAQRHVIRTLVQVTLSPVSAEFPADSPFRVRLHWK